MAVWTVFFSTVLVPLATIFMLWLRPRRPLNAWVATLIMAAGVVGFSVLAAPWGWFGIPLRVGLLLLFVAAVIISLRRPVFEEKRDESPLRMVVKGLIAILFGGVAIGVLRAHGVPPGAVDLQFPLRNGAFLVAHGGSHGAANMHAIDPVQRYGVDLVRINDAGMRARGLYPSDVTRYAVWNAEVVSPCSGSVTASVDTFPDLKAGVRDEKNKLGNHLVVRCGDVDVTLAHLKQGSVAAKKGSPVAAGAVVGRVGNSGDTTEPHLHVHASRNGVAVPARFDGRWLVRNAVVRP
jgi:hypothetical protein